MEIIAGFLYVFGFLGLFILALVLVNPVGCLISRRLDPWPLRPMANEERKAAWALKYHQATPIQPNTWRWKFKKEMNHE